VDADDLAAFQFGMTEGAYWTDGDVDYNNNVNADDLTVFANNDGKSGL